MEKHLFKLHLGCGMKYLPNYVNIDTNLQSVADLICDVTFLPIKNGIVQEIIAEHLIEHFDLLTTKFLFAEFFTLLVREGILILETPDLNRTFKIFSSSGVKRKKNLISWIFGIGEEGFQHKTGFTSEIIHEYLTDVGFRIKTISKRESHKFEPSIRIVSTKIAINDYYSLIANFRSKIVKNFQLVNSRFLTYLEKEIFEDYDFFNNNNRAKKNSAILKQTVARLAICNPQLATLFIDLLLIHDLINLEDANQINLILSELIQINFHQRALISWKNFIKNEKNLEEQYNLFKKNLEEMIIGCFHNPDTFQKRLEYFKSLTTEFFPFFTLFNILERANGYFNHGIRLFYLKKYEKAIENFNSSIKLNPYNFLIYWNLGRLGIVTKRKELVQTSYLQAQRQVEDRSIKKIINKEIILLKKNPLQIPKFPVIMDLFEN